MGKSNVKTSFQTFDNNEIIITNDNDKLLFRKIQVQYLEYDLILNTLCMLHQVP